MDALAVKQACKFAKEHALKNGPLVRTYTTDLSVCLYFPSYVRRYFYFLRQSDCFTFVLLRRQMT